MLNIISYDLMLMIDHIMIIFMSCHNLELSYRSLGLECTEIVDYAAFIFVLSKHSYLNQK